MRENRDLGLDEPAGQTPDTRLAPVWQWESLFPGGPEGSSFRQQRSALIKALTELRILFDELRIGRPAMNHSTEHGRSDQGRTFDRVLDRTCDVLLAERVLSLYLAGACWEHTDDAVASARYLQFQGDVSVLPDLMRRLEKWAALLESVGELTSSDRAESHRRWLDRCRRAQAHCRAPEPEHDGVVDASYAGRVAWQREYEDLVGALTVVVDGASLTAQEAEDRLLMSTDLGARSALQKAIDDAWVGIQAPAADCLNAVKDDELRTTREQRWRSPLHRSLLEQDIDVDTFAGMQQAAELARAALHDFALIKARSVGQQRLHYRDLLRPLKGETPLTWTEAITFVVNGFEPYHRGLSTHTLDAINAGWVHAAPTRSKRTTALCLPLQGGESRLMFTFDGSMGSILSFGHELGHSYHYLIQSRCSDLQRLSSLFMQELPAVLCENLLASNAARSGSSRAAGSDGHHHLAVLHSWLLKAFQRIVGGHARYVFEQSVLFRREAGPLSVNDFQELMRAAQRTSYGDCVEEGSLPRQAWVSHPHLYTSTLHSWPYTFAALMALALSDSAGKPDIAPSDLDDLLTSTGTVPHAQLARRLHVDLRDTSFWMRGVEVLRARVALFDELVGGRSEA
jgi:oligoendopeptidase F